MNYVRLLTLQPHFLKKGRVDRSLSLCCIINGWASVGELLDALGLASLDLEVTHLN